MVFKYSPYSFSKLNTYEMCPKRFKFRYIKKEKEGECDKSALIRGSAIHEMFENHQKGKEPKKSKYTADFKKAIERPQVKKIKKHLESPEKTCREVSFGMTKDFSPCEYKDKNALFRGKIDLVYIDNGVLNLADYKTGKAKDEKYQNYDQLLLYSIYFFQRYPSLEKLKISYVYVDQDVVNSLEVLRSFIETHKAHFLSIVNSIEADQEYIAKPSKLCHWCPYHKKCKESQESQECHEV